MSELVTAFTSLGGVLVGALLLYMGNRYVANKSNQVGRAQVEVESRKVDQAAFEQFTRTYEREMTRLTAQVEQTTKWLALSLQHIKQLRRDVADSRELTAFPQELKDIPFWILDTNDDGTPARRRRGPETPE